MKQRFIKQRYFKMNTQTVEQLYKDLPFGLSVVTAYNNGKITAKFTHGDKIKTSVKVSYNQYYSTPENHMIVALKCLEKVEKEHNKEFEIVYYSYSEKDTGYSFVCKRIN